MCSPFNYSQSQIDEAVTRAIKDVRRDILADIASHSRRAAASPDRRYYYGLRTAAHCVKASTDHAQKLVYSFDARGNLSITDGVCHG